MRTQRISARKRRKQYNTFSLGANAREHREKRSQELSHKNPQNSSQGQEKQAKRPWNSFSLRRDQSSFEQLSLYYSTGTRGFFPFPFLYFYTSRGWADQVDSYTYIDRQRTASCIRVNNNNITTNRQLIAIISIIGIQEQNNL